MFLFLTYFTLYAVAAAKSLKSCWTLCDPIDGSPLGPPVPGILQARTLEWVIGSSFIHLIRTESNAFLFIAEYYSIVYMYHNFLFHSSADGHLGCFHVLAGVNSASINIGVHVSLSIMVSLPVNHHVHQLSDTLVSLD